jgi:hypothetical protein
VRTIIYVSGPYSRDPDTDTNIAIDYGNTFFNAGYAPIVPHLTHFWHTQHTERDYEDWMALDLAIVERVDAVFRIPGPSSGADREVALAESLGIPVFHSLGGLFASIPPEQPAASKLPQPIASALASITATFASKSADYAEDGSWASNFEDVADQMGWASPSDAVEALIAVKQSRLRALRANGREPRNEGVTDTKLDRAVYSVIALAMLLDEL